MTMVLVETLTVETPVTFIDITGIPQDATDLLIIMSSREGGDQSSDSGFQFTVNGAYGDFKAVYGQITQVVAQTGSNLYVPSGMPTGGATAGAFGNTQIYIPNYTLSQRHPVAVDSVGENVSDVQFGQKMSLFGGLTSSSQPVTSMRIIYSNDAIQPNTTVFIYKIS